MNRTQRRLFMWLFIFLFALVAPTVILLAQGYRFSLENNIFVYSGSITIKSWPRDVNIFINGKQQASKNLNIINGSHTINGIKPGKYQLACSKPGYTTWEKEVEVHSGVSTEFWNVLLFPEENSQNKPALVGRGEIKQVFLSPNSNNELVLFSEENLKKQIYLLNTTDNSSELIFETENFNFVPKEEGLNIEWNTNNKKILLPVNDKENQRKYLIIDTEEEDKSKFTILNDFFKNGYIHQARWMFNDQNVIALLTEKNNLFSFDYKKELVELIAENASGFDFAEYNIYYAQLPNNIIWKVKQDNFKSKKQISNEPLLIEGKNLFTEITAYDEYRIFVNSDNKSFLHNENNKKNLISTLKPSEKISGIQFSDDGKKLLCWNDHEVWYYMLRDWEIQPKRYFGDKITITRSSEQIKNVQWMDSYENILLSAGNSVKSFEIDPRNHTNISGLATAEESIQDKNLLYNKNNQTLYFLSNNKIFSLIAIDNAGLLGF